MSNKIFTLITGLAAVGGILGGSWLKQPADDEESQLTVPHEIAELQEVDPDSALGKRLLGDSRCGTYKWPGDREKMIQKCQFYDPLRKGSPSLPLLEVTEDDLSKYLSDHFKVEEVSRANFPELMPEEYLIWKHGEAFFKYIRISPELLEMAEELREAAGMPLATRRSMALDEGTDEWHECTPENLKEYRERMFAEGTVDQYIKNCRKHGFRPYVYNLRMYDEADHQRAARRSLHVSGKALDLAIPLCEIYPEAKSVFKAHGLGGGNLETHIDALKGGSWRGPDKGRRMFYDGLDEGWFEKNCRG